MSGLPRGLWACMCLILAVPSVYAEWPLHGRVKAEYAYSPLDGDSLESRLGKNDLHDSVFNFRLKWRQQLGGWNLVTHYQFNLNHGDGQSLRQRIERSLPGFFIDLDKTRLLPLTATSQLDDETEIEQGLDRLSVAYTSEQWVLGVGRQVLTWGNGIVFRPMDLFNPFGPTATDTEYKPGADMVYGQWLFEEGSDVQGVTIIRRDPVTRKLAFDQDSTAVKWHHFGAVIQADFMFARHYRDYVLGTSFSGPVGTAVWHVDTTATWLDSGNLALSMAANIDFSWPKFNTPKYNLFIISYLR